MGTIIDYGPAIQAYLSGLTLTEAVAKHGGTRKSLVKRLTARGIEVRPRVTYWAYRINHAAFDVLTDEVAYWTGMLMADGSIRVPPRKMPQIRLDLADRDRKHLERFRDFLVTDHPIYPRTIRPASGHVATYGILSVSSQQIADRLVGYGVLPLKRDRLGVIWLEHNRHFWRGVMDGDGCLTWTAKHPAIHLIGNEVLMRQFCEHIAQYVQVHLTPRRFPSRNYWTVCAYCRNAVAVADYLYSGQVVALERKQARARQFSVFYH